MELFEKKKCEICKNSAKILCLKCVSYYCDSCSKFIHNQKENNQHKPENIDLFVPIDTKCSMHSKYPIDYFCLEEKELCCSNCIYKNMHCNHKILEIEDENGLKKENITIESCKKEFDGLGQKMDELKNKIKKEVEEIDKLYENTNNEITKSYKIKHEKLAKEEDDLKTILQTEVTKVKEKLEIYSVDLNRSIDINERINKGISKLEKKENMLKILSYVSKMNRFQKDTKKLLSELLRNLKISFIEEESKINYDEYFFNGIQIPRNIEVFDIKYNSFKLKWSIDDLNILDIDNKEIKFRVEIKKENSRDLFKKVYEDKELECLIENLKEGTNYEIRICSIYKDIIGQWSEIKRVKMVDIDSIILSKTNDSHKYLNKIFEWTGYKNLELLYRSNRDGANSEIFHKKCDNQGPTICLIKNKKDNIFGGFSSISWTSDGKIHEDKKCFIFTLVNNFNTEPSKFVGSDTNNIYHNKDKGPCFGNYNDLVIGQEFENEPGFTVFPCNFNDNLGKGKSIFTGDNNNENSEIQIDIIEVFKIF